MHCLFRSNVGDVRMMPFMSYISNIMLILGHKIFYRYVNINPCQVGREILHKHDTERSQVSVSKV